MISIVRHFIGRVATVGLVFLLIPVGLSLLAATGWPFELASHFVFYYATGGIVLALCFLIAGMWIRFGFGLVVVVFCGFQMMPQVYPPAPPRVGEEAMFRVGMANLNSGNREVEKVAEWIREESPDVLVFLEINNRWVKDLEHLLADYPYRIVEPRNSAFGMLLASKTPLTEPTTLNDPQEGNAIPMIVSKIGASGKELHLAIAHPIPPTGRERVNQRNAYLFALADHIFHLGNVPVLVAGDLNCTPWSPDFDKFLSLSNLKDSSHGRGLEWTWRPFPAIPALGLPIDHFLHSEEVVVLARRIGADIGSDHRPMTVDINIEESIAP